MGSIKGEHPVNLMVVDLNDLLVFRADIFQTGVDLVKREVKRVKKFRDHFLKSPGF